MLFSLSIVFALALGPSEVVAANPAAPAAEAAAERAAKLAALPASDEDIDRALWQMLERDPERVVCSIRVHTGSRQKRTSCATLDAWFRSRKPQEIQARDAPWQLVEEIKEQRKKALLRSRGS